MNNLPILKKNGFSAFIHNKTNETLEIDIISPYEDVEENDSIRGDYLTFKTTLNGMDIIRKAKRDSLKIYYNIIHTPE